MKKWISVLSVVLIAGFLGGCTGSCKQSLSHTKSNWIGINREIVLYSGGKVVYQGMTKEKIEITNGFIRFFDTNDCVVMLSGDLYVQEKE